MSPVTETIIPLSLSLSWTWVTAIIIHEMSIMERKEGEDLVNNRHLSRRLGCPGVVKNKRREGKRFPNRLEWYHNSMVENVFGEFFSLKISLLTRKEVRYLLLEKMKRESFLGQSCLLSYFTLHDAE